MKRLSIFLISFALLSFAGAAVYASDTVRVKRVIGVDAFEMQDDWPVFYPRGTSNITVFLLIARLITHRPGKIVEGWPDIFTNQRSKDDKDDAGERDHSSQIDNR